MKSLAVLVLLVIFSTANGFLMYPKCETTSHPRAQNQEIICTCNTGQGHVSFEQKYNLNIFVFGAEFWSKCEQNFNHIFKESCSYCEPNSDHILKEFVGNIYFCQSQRGYSMNCRGC